MKTIIILIILAIFSSSVFSQKKGDTLNLSSFSFNKIFVRQNDSASFSRLIPLDSMYVRKKFILLDTSRGNTNLWLKGKLYNGVIIFISL